MSRGICTVFVALVTFQGAVAINVEPHSVINLAMTNRTSRSILFDEKCANRFIGNVAIGNRSEHYDYDVTHDAFGNGVDSPSYSKRTIKSVQGRKIRYFSAVNKEGSNADFCVDESTLGSDAIVVTTRFPPNSLSFALYTVGLDHIQNSSSVKAIQALLIPFTVITLLLTSFHL
ncbi:uncharacterized protein LOC143212784 isoform X2 [Lasioglossum baleicum]|uniref:uncharacterized protein LOC143212784 isoform X2 n=1 Tax=Lasioglossum baleicum TaxID=434251 RepID=UPI003FCC5E6E